MKRSPLSQLQVDIIKSAGRNYPELRADQSINPIIGAVALLAGDIASQREDPDRAVEAFAELFKTAIIQAFERDVWKGSESKRYPLQRLSTPPKEQMQ